MFDLSGRHALVTAAGTPLADGLALALAEAGAQVSLLNDESATSQTAAAAALEKCGQAGSRGIHLGVAVGDPEQVHQAVRQIEAAVAPLDILVNARMPSTVKAFSDTTADDWQRVLHTGAVETFAAIQAAGAGMKERGYGRIINLTSGIADQPNLAPYSVSKAAVDKYTRDLAFALKDANVLVNYLDPGWLKTDMGGPDAWEEVETVLPGALVPALLDENGPTGRHYAAQDFKVLA